MPLLIIDKFYQDYKDTQTIYLNTNYRCAPQITEISQRLIIHNRNRIAKNIVSGTENTKGVITIIGNESNKEMYLNILEKFQNKSLEELNSFK